MRKGSFSFRRSAMAAAAGCLTLLTSLTPARATELDPPTLTAPDPGASLDGNPILRWDPMPGAVKYQVQLSASESFTSYLANVTTYNTNYTHASDLPLGALYWRVASHNGSVLGAYVASSFVKSWSDSPTLIAPADAAALGYPDDPPTFSWEPLAGSKEYRLEIDDAADFIGATTYTTKATTFTPTEPQTTQPHVWYWRVRGVASSATVTSDWSETRSYSILWNDAPVLVAPANTNSPTIEDVAFVWQPIAGAKTYNLQVSPNGDFANNKSIDVSVKGTRYSPPETLDNGSYFWRVQAKDGATAQNGGPWSAVWQFTRAWSDLPTLVSPADADFNVELPELSWSPIDHASHYELQVGTDENFSPNTYQKCFTNRTSFTPYTLIEGTAATPGSCLVDEPAPGTQYFWRVRGIDSPADVNGEWSATRSFIYKPEIPQPTGPADGASVSAPVLTWNAVPDITKYRVTIRDASGDTITDDTYSTSYTPIEELLPADGPFRWTVVTVDQNGAQGLTPSLGSWWSFDLVAPSPTYAAPTLTAPADGAQTTRMPSLQWSPVTGAHHYTVWVGVSGSGVVQALGTNLPFAAYTYPDDIKTPGVYVWYVHAYTEGGALIASSDTSHTFEIVNLMVATYVSPADCDVLVSCSTLSDTPTLVWDPVPEAAYYLVHLAPDAAFTSTLKKVYKTQFTRFSPRESLLDNQAGQAYYWFVQPCKKDLRCGQFDSSVHGNAFAFRKASPAVELQSPDPGATVPDLVTFTWRDYLATNGDLAPSSSQEAKWYRIQVSTVPNFASILDTHDVDQTTYTPYGKTYPEGPLYWRVQAIDRSGNSLTTSAVRGLTKQSAPVQPLGPSDQAIVTGIPTLSWTPQPYAWKYDVEIYKNGDTTYAPVNKVSLTGTTTKLTEWSPTAAIAGGSYAWRVRRQDADGLVGPWSSGTWRFTLQPDAPGLLAPDEEASITSPNLLFQWTDVPGAVRYQHELSTTASFTTSTKTKTVMTSWAPTTNITTGGYWRVSVLDAADNVLRTSAARHFFKDSTAPTVLTKAPTASLSITGNLTVTFSEEVANVTTTTFTMKVAGTSSSIDGAVTMPNATTAVFNPSVTLVPGQSYTLSLSNGIVDTSGNPLVPFSWTVRTSTVVENVSPAFIEYWDRDSHPSASGGAYDAANVSGAKTTFSFTGTNVAVIGSRHANGGYARIYLDGVAQGSDISFYNSSTQWQRTMWSITGLTDGPHTLEVRVLGTKPSASSGTFVFVDAFTVGAVSHQENNAAVTDRWRTIAASGALGGSYDLERFTASGDTSTKPSARVTFKGTGIDVYALKSARSGKVLVYLDGAYRGSVDLYRSSTQYGARVYQSPSLTNGVHTLVLYPAGAKNASSSSYDVGLDRLLVR